MIQVKDYKILSAETRRMLEKSVIDLMEDGYYLSGGVYVDEDYFYQAMYKNQIQM